MESKKFNSQTTHILSNIRLNLLNIVIFISTSLFLPGCQNKESASTDFSYISTYKIKTENLVNELNLYNSKELSSIGIIYPKGICDVCDKDIFSALKKHQDSQFYDKLIVLVPIENYRDIILYNKEYDLRFNSIIPYRGSILPDEIILKRATFVELIKSSVMRMYTPNKPIDPNKLDNFLSVYDPSNN